MSGFTTESRRRHSNSQDRATSAIRVASSARRGVTSRSTYNASCFLRNRFSAASWTCGRAVAATNHMRSRAIRRTVRTREHHLDRAIGAGSYAIQQTPILNGLRRAASIGWASGQFRSKSGRADFFRGTAVRRGASAASRVQARAPLHAATRKTHSSRQRRCCR